jgi:hypothetical protein
MSIYDKSSLVLIPSGTKTGKVFSQKPVSGDGDFTFTRASAATRVNADGNIEKETQNLLLQSNTFTSSWSVGAGVTRTSGQAGYDGTNDAWEFEKTAGNAYVYQTASQSGVNTFSVYLKAGTLNWARLQAIDAGNNPNAFFDLQNGVVGGTQGSNYVDSSIESIGGGWYRCKLVFSQGTTQVRIYPADADGVVSGTSGSIYAQDAQLEQGLVARDVITTTTAAVYGGITDNTPRLDYTDSSCPALLLEPSRTNMLFHSEYISAGVTWSTNGGMLTESNSVASPENLVNATKMTRPNGTGAAWLTNFLGGVVGQNQVLSVYAKAGTATIFNITYYDATAGDLFFNYDLSAGSVNAPTGSAYYVDSSIEDVGDGWYRCIAIVETANSGLYQIAIGNNRSGAANEYLYVYGTQWESNASYATSYIPTYGSSVSRVNDYAKVDNRNNIGQTEGTMFVEMSKVGFGTSAAIENVAFSMFEISTSSQRYLVFRNNGVIQFVEVVNGVQANIISASGVYTDGENIKIAVAYSQDDFVLYINGTLINSDTSGNVAPCDRLVLGYTNDSTFIGQNNYKQALLFKTRLSNEELAALTTI